MQILNRKTKFLFFSFLKHDFKASIAVFFVALPLCLGVAIASNASVYSGLIAGVVGGIVISLISKSSLSVSGPAAGLTAISAAAITDLGGIQIFFLAVSVAGILQLFLGIFKLGGFTHFIPSTVIKGMLSGIGVILISKQIPPLLGYNKPEFWANEFFNIITLNHVYNNVKSFYHHTTAGVIITALTTFMFYIFWKNIVAHKFKIIPESLAIVLFGSVLAFTINSWFPHYQIKETQFVHISEHILNDIHFPTFSAILSNAAIWKTAVVICFVASLETLLSIEAIDKLDPYNRITPQNRELMAQGTANIICGILGGLPITSVIVRSSANAEAGAKTRMSAFFHGLWLLIAIVLGVKLINHIPYCVLAIILIRTGFNLIKPKMIVAIYKQGREQFLPFLITIISILLTDLLIGVLIGVGYSIYFLIKHTYKAGFIIEEKEHLGIKIFEIKLALNVSYLNKKRIIESLDNIPFYSKLIVDGNNCIYIDNDILEILQDFKSKAKNKHIEIEYIKIPEVTSIELH